jgi:hypothetical protein
VKLTALIIAAFSVTAAGSQALALADQSDDVAATPLAVTNVAPAPSDVVVEQTPASPITFSQRLSWFDEKTFGVPNLMGSIPGAALSTGLNHPHEAGPHWSGFGERYGVSVSTNALSNATEATLGAAWGEDPRYFRAGETAPFKSRLGHIIKWTVVARDRDGDIRPAYARFVAYSSSSFISDAWREPTDRSVGNEFARIGLDFLGRMGGNAFDEFWPDTKRKLFHHAPKADTTKQDTN